jgi:hypothetical protein
MPDKQSLDILGIQPIADAANKLVSASVDGAAAFLSRVCLPAAEEFGLLLRDRVHRWRTQNQVVLVNMAERKLAASGATEGVHAPPRLVARIMDEGSWIPDSEVQEMWAGLLSSSCTESGDDDSNLLFVDLLSGLTKLQAKILRYGCETALKFASPTGLVYTQFLAISREDLFAVTAENDVDRLDREIDRLRELGLLDPHSGFHLTGDFVVLTPSSLGLHMYVRCQGMRASPIDYFGLKAPHGEPGGNAPPAGTG